MAAPNAKVAIELVETERPDLILLDLGLPGMGGHDLLRKWRDDGLDIPVVILSSRTDEAGIVTALELGADDMGGLADLAMYCSPWVNSRPSIAVSPETLTVKGQT